MKSSSKLLLATAGLALAPLLSGHAGYFSYQGDPSVSEIRIGMSNAESGQLAFIGNSVKEGAEAYFSKINSAGGVNGRKIVLKSYDDGYEPLAAVNNTEKLIDTDNVFALMGYVGTSTCRSILKPLALSQIKLVGAFTGAGPLRAKDAGIYNVRATYDQEAAQLVNHLFHDLGAKRIAIFRQNDSYGDAGKSAVLKAVAAMQTPDLQVVDDSTFTRNSVDVQDALNSIVPKKPDAVIMIGAYKACAAFIIGAKLAGLTNTTFCNVSFVGTEPLIKFLNGNGDHVYISQVVPSPNDTSLKLVKEYQEDMKAAGNQTFDYASLEGYIDARVLVSAIQAAGPQLNQASFTQALNNLKVDLGGVKISYSPDDHTGSSAVYLTRVEGNQAVQVEKMQ